MKIKIISVILLILCLPIFAKAEFKLVPADKEYSTEGNANIGMQKAYYTKRQIFTKLPPQMKDNYQTTRLNIDFDTFFNVAIYNNKATNDAIIIDINNDSDLTNDPIITDFTMDQAIKPIPVKLYNGNVVDVLIIPSPWGLSYKALQWHKGEITLGKKKFDAVLIDRKVPGYIPNGSDLILIDLNKDGKFNFQKPTDFKGSEMILLEKTMNIKNKLYSMDIKYPDLDIIFSPYTDKIGKLDFNLKFVKKQKNPSFTLTLIPENNFYQYLYITSKQMPYKLPVGKYSISGYLYYDKKDKSRAVVNFKFANPITIDENKTTELTLDKNTPYKITLSNNQNILTVTQNLIDPNGIEYLSMCNTENKYGNIIYSLIYPSVTIFSDAGTDVIAEGALSYNTDGSCTYSYDISENLKTNNKFNVKVIWETGELFGTLEAEKTITIKYDNDIKKIEDYKSDKLD